MKKIQIFTSLASKAHLLNSSMPEESMLFVRARPCGRNRADNSERLVGTFESLSMGREAHGNAHLYGEDKRTPDSVRARRNDVASERLEGRQKSLKYDPHRGKIMMFAVEYIPQFSP